MRSFFMTSRSLETAAICLRKVATSSTAGSCFMRKSSCCLWYLSSCCRKDHHSRHAQTSEERTPTCISNPPEEPTASRSHCTAMSHEAILSGSSARGQHASPLVVVSKASSSSVTSAQEVRLPLHPLVNGGTKLTTSAEQSRQLPLMVGRGSQLSGATRITCLATFAPEWALMSFARVALSMWPAEAAAREARLAKWELKPFTRSRSACNSRLRTIILMSITSSDLTSINFLPAWLWAVRKWSSRARRQPFQAVAERHPGIASKAKTNKQTER
mmetsp:Transcript_60476/g.162900  ORF Transcript_60476/g.162900 Transcript_60476/m.162900 type:complete len:273 (+) Transcript_60476:624-1442(+)